MEFMLYILHLPLVYLHGQKTSVLLEPKPADTSLSSVAMVLQFNLMRVEICELRPKVVTKDDGVLVHYQSRTNMWQWLSSKTFA